MTKQELINQLKHIHLNFEFGLACISLINDPIAMKALPSLHVDIFSKRHSHDRIIKILNGKEKEMAIRLFLNMVLMTSTLKDSYNAIVSYCNSCQPEQHSKLRRQPYFQYIRMIRNAMSHGYKFNFDGIKEERKATLFPIKWDGKIINESDEGKEISNTQLSYEDLFILLHELNQFVKKKLV